MLRGEWDPKHPVPADRFEGILSKAVARSSHESRWTYETCPSPATPGCSIASYPPALVDV